MKKNILTIIILAATLVNLTLSAVMLFVYLPNAQKMNTLITKICQVIDLDLESPLPVPEDEKVAVADLESHVISSDMVVGLSKGEDGKIYYASIAASLVLNTKAEDYATVSTLMTTQSERIKEIVQIEVGKLNKDNFHESREAVREAILATLQEEFETKCIYRVDFGNYLVAE
ncbi:MAG: hypothetical protein IJY09_11565 [Lachnospiraceae bacterium]|nr:hypothetical protein [Lachnospiraceae bacterium]